MGRNEKYISQGCCRRWNILIFVVLGTQKFQFNRLLKKIDEIAGKDYDFFAQIGNSNYTPNNYSYCKFMDKQQFDYYVEECEFIITHSGVGSIISALKKDKTVIVVPRKAEYGEHIDNHQMEIAEVFSQKGYVVACDDIEKLKDCMEQIKSMHFEKYISGKKNIIGIIENYIENIE